MKRREIKLIVIMKDSTPAIKVAALIQGLYRVIGDFKDDILHDELHLEIEHGR